MAQSSTDQNVPAHLMLNNFINSRRKCIYHNWMNNPILLAITHRFFVRHVSKIWLF
jgi:hypothetical protein